ncbi:MAG: ABC transporter substrate-binding protein [Alphaproteobacteria bacterium]|nr:ABC transporter substrate-binding protein [Alphaproteobacteria bacterium]
MRTAFALLMGSIGLVAGPAMADTPLKFSLDFIMFGSNSPFVYAAEHGYFKEAALDVTIDSSSGSGDAVNRLATGTYDIAYSDVSTLIEFASKNPDVAPKVVLFIQEYTPAVIMALTASGIKNPQDLMGHSLGTAMTDAGSRMFPTFARLNNIEVSKVNMQTVDFRLRDSMFAQKRFDAIIAFRDSVLNARNLGLPVDEINVISYGEWGLPLYGNAMIASRKLIESNPDALRKAVDAAAKAWRDVARDPKVAIDALVKRDPLAKADLELERLTLLVNNQVITPNTKANGIGAADVKRLDEHIKLISEGYQLQRQPSRTDIYDDRFLPPLADRKFTN